MPYLYETHLHTCQASACGTSTGREHARFYKELGFQGIIMTDHFFGGNTCVPFNLPWKERIDRFCSGYEDALAEGQRIGLDVFFGWEQGFGDDEYLVYGLDKAWLLAHPEMEHWTRREQLTHVHQAGGCVIQAHPFRNRFYIRHVRLGLDYADGAEVANGGNIAVNDAYAYRYAKDYNLVMTAGSDNHLSGPEAIQERRIYGVELEHRLRSIQDFVQIVLRHEPIGLHVPPERFHPDLDGCVPIPSYFLDEKEQLRPTYRDWLFEDE